MDEYWLSLLYGTKPGYVCPCSSCRSLVHCGAQVALGMTRHKESPRVWTSERARFLEVFLHQRHPWKELENVNELVHFLCCCNIARTSTWRWNGSDPTPACPPYLSSLIFVTAVSAYCVAGIDPFCFVVHTHPAPVRAINRCRVNLLALGGIEKLYRV